METRWPHVPVLQMIKSPNKWGTQNKLTPLDDAVTSHMLEVKVS
jgi:hypothetical protein